MLKQYVIVPKSIKMSPGKIASQVAHATFMALEKENRALINRWKHGGMCVIVLECKDNEQLRNTDSYLISWNIIHHLYIDEGLTEVDPMTPTVLATGILDEEDQWMFSQFKMYKERYLLKIIY